MAEEFFGENDMQDSSDTPSEEDLDMNKLRAYRNDYNYQLYRIKKILKHKKLTKKELKALKQRRNTTQYRLNLEQKAIREDLASSLDPIHSSVSTQISWDLKLSK